MVGLRSFDIVQRAISRGIVVAAKVIKVKRYY